MINRDDLAKALKEEFSFMSASHESWLKSADGIISKLSAGTTHEPDNPQGVWCCEDHRKEYHREQDGGEASSRD